MDDSHPEAVRFECGDTTYVLKVGMAAFQLAKFRHGIDIRLSDLDRIGKAFDDDKQKAIEEGEIEKLAPEDLDRFDDVMGLVYKVGWAAVLPNNPDLSFDEFRCVVALAGADEALATATMEALAQMNAALPEEEAEKRVEQSGKARASKSAS